MVDHVSFAKIQKFCCCCKYFPSQQRFNSCHGLLFCKTTDGTEDTKTTLVIKHRIGRIERIFSYLTVGIFVFSCFSCHSYFIKRCRSPEVKRRLCNAKIRKIRQIRCENICLQLSMSDVSRTFFVPLHYEQRQ